MLGLHQQGVFAIAGGGLKQEDRVAAGVRRCRQLLHWHSHPQANVESKLKLAKRRRGDEGGPRAPTVYGVKLKVAFRVFGPVAPRTLQTCKQEGAMMPGPPLTLDSSRYSNIEHFCFLLVSSICRSKSTQTRTPNGTLFTPFPCCLLPARVPRDAPAMS
jgi:hypothetical protein